MLHIQRGGRKTILCGLVMCICLCLLLTSVVPIAFADDNETAFEAMWGADKDNLTGSGTLTDAIAAANATGSTIKYIRLNKSWTATGTSITHYSIQGEGITFDLYGQTVSGPLILRADAGSVTFTDSIGGGKWECTHSDGYAVTVREATATFTGGSYKGKMAVVILPNSTAVIKDGTFESTGDYAVFAENPNTELTIEGGSFTGGAFASVGSYGTLTIKGGSFTDGTMGHIVYWGGTLDLSSYPATATTGTTALTDLTINNRTDKAATVGTEVKLPEGYSFYKADDASKATVTELAANTKYAIKPADIVSVDISWTSTTFTYNDGTWDPATHTYVGQGWSTEDGNCTVTVENSGTLPITANFDVARYYVYLDCGLDKRGFDLDAGESNSTTLSVVGTVYTPGHDGKPVNALDGDQIGTLTISISQKTQTRQGWLTEGESTYYYKDGVKLTGLQTFRPTYFNASNIVRTYYFDPDTGAMQTGWQEIWSSLDGKLYWYYFYEDGHMAANEYVPGTEIWVGSDGKSTTGSNE